MGGGEPGYRNLVRSAWSGNSRALVAGLRNNQEHSPESEQGVTSRGPSLRAQAKNRMYFPYTADTLETGPN